MLTSAGKDKVTVAINYQIIMENPVRKITECVQNSIEKRRRDKKNCKTPWNEFEISIHLIVNSMFQFDDVIYKRKFVTPMGSPISPIIAYIVMRDLEEKCFSNVDFDITIYLHDNIHHQQYTSSSICIIINMHNHQYT